MGVREARPRIQIMNPGSTVKKAVLLGLSYRRELCDLAIVSLVSRGVILIPQRREKDLTDTQSITQR
jgi:hypothetical protein